MKTKIVSILEVLILLFTILALSTFLSPCSGDMVMKCNHSVNVVKLLFVTGILVKVIGLFVKEQAAIYFNIFANLLYVDSILVPAWLVGGCQMADMACRSAAFPGIYVVSILLIIINVISILGYLWKRKGSAEV